MNYYNEHDPKAAAWLRELIRAGEIPSGEVDERSIVDVKPNELSSYNQCHFFAGIGGWSLALKLAGWPDNKPVWTGSCPCQPLSCAGQRKGHADERHLWPAFYSLISKRNPPVVFGEQVASKDGREWLAGIRADLEGVGYAVGAADLCSAGVGAPHVRQRLYWVADANLSNEHRWTPGGKQPLRGRVQTNPARMGNAAGARLEGEWNEYSPCQSGEETRLLGFAMQNGVPNWNGTTLALLCEDGPRRASAESGAFPVAHGLPARMGRLRGYGNAIVPQVACEFIGAWTDTANGDCNSSD